MASATGGGGGPGGGSTGGGTVAEILASFPEPPKGAPRKAESIESKSDEIRNMLTKMMKETLSEKQLKTLTDFVNTHSEMDVQVALESALDQLTKRSATVSQVSTNFMGLKRVRGWFDRVRGRGDPTPTASYPDIRVPNCVMVATPAYQVVGATASDTPKMSSLRTAHTLSEAPACQFGSTLSMSWNVKNIGRYQAQVSFRPVAISPPGSFQVENIEPAVLVLKKGKEGSANITIKTTRAGCNATLLIAGEVVGGITLFVVIRARIEPSIYGVPIAELDLINDRGFMVPDLLRSLRKQLHAQNGLGIEGIFRRGADREDMRKAKAELNLGRAPTYKNAHTVAFLIKLFFREMPTSLLSDIPPDVLVNTKDNELAALVEYVKPPKIGLLRWVVDLMTEVASRDSENMMNMRNCAIVFGPNLFTVDERANPMMALMVSQKATSFLLELLKLSKVSAPGASGPLPPTEGTVEREAPPVATTASTTTPSAPEPSVSAESSGAGPSTETTHDPTREAPEAEPAAAPVDPAPLESGPVTLDDDSKDRGKDSEVG